MFETSIVHNDHSFAHDSCNLRKKASGIKIPPIRGAKLRQILRVLFISCQGRFYLNTPPSFKAPRAL